MTIQDEPTLNETKKRSPRVFLWIALGVVVVVLIGATIAFFLVRNGESGNLEKARAAVQESNWAVAAAAADAALATRPAFLRQHETEALALSGLAYYQLADYDTALGDIDSALEMDPDLVDLLVYRADIQQRQDDDQAALADLQKAMADATLLPDHLLALAHARLAQISHDQDQGETAAQEATAALALGQYLDEQTIAQLYAIRALGTFDLADPEPSLAENYTALEIAPDLPAGLRAALLADQVAAYSQAGLDDMVLQTSREAMALDVLSAEDEAALGVHRASALYNQGDLPGAIAEAEAAAANGQGEALLHALRAAENYQAGDEQQALAEAESALEAGEESALAYRVQGSVRAWEGRIEEAIGDLEQAVALEPAEVEALAMLVYAHLELNDLEAADEALIRAQEADPAAPATLWAEAQLAYYRYDWPTAKALLDLAIEQDDSRPEFYTWRSWTYQTTAEGDQARQDLQVALSLNDDFLPAMASQLAWRQEYGELDGFEEDANQLVETYPDNYRAYTVLGYYQLYIQADSEAALETAERILELRPESTAGYRLRGDIHRADEAYDLAQADYEQALVMRPNLLEAHYASAWNYILQEDYDLALAELDQVLTVDPQARGSMTQQAWIYSQQGDRQGAWQTIHQVLSVDPDYPDALITRAGMYLEADEPELALVDVQRVLDRFPKSAWALEELAEVYYAQERYDEMAQTAERALEVDPNRTEAYWHLWVAANHDGDPEQALDVAETWTEAAPDAAYAFYCRGVANNWLSNSQEALDDLTTALSLAEEDDPLLGYIYLAREESYIDLGDPELARADLEALLTSSASLDQIDEAEITLTNPAVMASTIDGRIVVEDRDNGFTISYDQAWDQWPTDPSSGLVLSLGQGDDSVYASAELYIYDWDPADSLDYAADLLCPDETACMDLTRRPIQMAGQNGLLQTYEITQFGTRYFGQHYIVAMGNRLALLVVWATDERYPDFNDEFQAMADSFAFLE